MKSFLIKISFFCIPLLLLVVPPAVILKLSGENYCDIDSYVMSSKKYLVGFAYNQENYRYLKVREIQSSPRQEIMSIGSSRVLQFRQEMFKGDFYNAGYTISRITDFLPLIQQIPEDKIPEIIILSFDQWMFNENWDPVIPSSMRLRQYNFARNASIKTFRSVWRDLIDQKYDLASLITKKNDGDQIQEIGLNALVNDQGMRSDGSLFYGDQISKLMSNDSTAHDYRFQNTYERINTGNRLFEYGSSVNMRAVSELDKILSYCDKKNIKVVAFLPPFADDVNDKMDRIGKYRYQDQIISSIQPIFNKHQDEIWDMSDLTTFGSNDNEVIDGFHGGEVAYIKMLVHIANQDSKINDYIDVTALQDSIQQKQNRYTVYTYE